MFQIESCAKKQVQIEDLSEARRKGRLLKLESNSTATPKSGAQKLGNDDRRDFESIATKVCSPIGRKRHATCPRKRRVLSSNRTAQLL